MSGADERLSEIDFMSSTAADPRLGLATTPVLFACEKVTYYVLFD